MVSLRLELVHFYPRSPCGERHLRVLDGSKSSIISIHALLAESDERNRIFSGRFCHFYPRSPCGERPTNHGQATSTQQISIHALLAESDAYTMTTTICIVLFLSTLSLRRATGIIDILNNIIDHFYPRSPCGERRNQSGEDTNNGNFYPRSPCGERRAGQGS